MDISARQFTLGIAGASLVLVMLAFALPPAHAALLQGALLMAALGVSFQFIYTLLGQLSLGHSALFGAGAYVYAYYASKGYSLPFALLLSCSIGGLTGFIVSAATARLGGAYFAVVTFALANVISVVVASSQTLGLSEGLVGIPSFALIDLGTRSANQTVYAAGAFIITLAGFYTLWRSRFGWMLEAVRCNPRLAASLGINVVLLTVLTTVISGIFAGMIGAVAAQHARFVGPDIFGLYYIITPLSAVVIGGARSLLGAAAGIVIVFVVPVALSINPVLNQVVSGLLLATVVIFFPSGMVGAVSRFAKGKMMPIANLDANPRRLVNVTQGLSKQGEILLDAIEVDVSYGGVQAVSKMSLSLRRGHITGLIGANGAGKSSFVNALSGHVKSRARSIKLMGSIDIKGLSPFMIARCGLARTFQDNAVVETLTVRQSVMLAQCQGQIFPSRSRRSPNVGLIIDACGLTPLIDTKIENLTYLHRRMSALAMAVAMRPGVLFLDEATAGLTGSERAAVGSFLKSLAEDFGLAILIIEHDVEFVASISGQVIVMDSGRLLHDGTPQQVLNDPKVISSYLGDDWHASQSR